MDKEKNRIISLIKEFKIKANKKKQLDQIIFFGSRAVGKARKDSDVDLLLVAPAFGREKYYQRTPPFYL